MKSQAAMEYLITYGWALIAVMVLVSGLKYFGVFNTDDIMAENCYISSDINCKDYQIYFKEASTVGNPDEEWLEIYVKNLDRDDFYVSKVQCILGENHNMTILSNAFNTSNFDATNNVGILRTNRLVKIGCGGEAESNNIVRQGTTIKAKIILDIYTDSSFPHQIIGEVITKIK